MAFPWVIWGPEGEQFNTYTAPVRLRERRFALGTQLWLADGRKYAFAEAGGTLLAAGATVSSEDVAGNHDDISAVATAAGVGDWPVTLGATAAAEDLYGDGLVNVMDGPGEGHVYKIASQHDAVASGGIFTIPLAGSQTLQVASTTSTQLTLNKNPQRDVVVTPTTIVKPVIGVPPVAVAANSYFWNQIAGPASVLTITAVVLAGQNVRAAGVTTAGAVMVLNRDGTAEDEHNIGYCLETATTGEHALIYLQLD